MRAWLLMACFFALGAPLCAAEPPADAFCVITIQGVDDFRIVRYTVDQETSLDDRAALWPSVDTDGDGAIPPAQKHAFARSTVELWPDPSSLGIRNVTVRQGNAASAEALFVATWREVGHTFHQRDYATPETVTETSDLETQEIREFRFDVPHRPASVVLYGGGATADTPLVTSTTTTTTTPTYTIEYVVVRAPPGWIVSSITAHTYDGSFTRSYADAVVDVPAMDTKRPYQVTFLPMEQAALDSSTSMIPPSVNGLPAWGLVAGLAILAAMAAGRRQLPA